MLVLLLAPWIGLPAARADDAPSAVERWHAIRDEARQHRESGRLVDAVQSYARAADLARSEALPAMYEEDVLYAVIECLDEVGDMPAIRDACIRLLDVQNRLLQEAQGTGDAETVWEARRNLGRTLQDLGYLQTRLGDLRGAVERLREALGIAEELESRKELGHVLGRLANVEYVRGRFAQAMTAAEVSEDHFRTLDMPLGVIQALQTQWMIHRVRRDLEGARAVHEEAMSLLESMETRQPRTEGHWGELLARMLIDAGELDKAVETLEAAYGILRTAGDHAACGRIRTVLALAELQRGSLESALAHLVHDDVTSAPGLVAALTAARVKGEVLAALGRGDAASTELTRAVELSRQIGSVREESHALETLAGVRLAAGNVEGATAAVRRALDCLDLTTDRLTALEKREVSRRRSQLFELAARVALRHDDDRTAFSILERARATALIQQLGGAAESTSYASPETRARVQAARDQLVRAQDALARARADNDLRGARNALRRLGAARAAFAKTLERERRLILVAQPESQGPANGGRDPGRPLRALQDVAELQRSLDPGAAFVLYAQAADRLHALVITRRGLHRRELADAEEVRAGAERLRAFFRDARRRRAAGEALPARPELPPELGQLRTRLIARLGLPRSVTRLLVSPDASMGSLPYRMLVGPAQDVALVPSGTAYLMLARQASVRGERILALGDPRYPGRELDLDWARGPASGTTHVRLRRLPGTRDEIEAISDEDDVRLLDAAASEENLLDRLASRPRWRALHFACHGLCDVHRPEWSALALTPTAKSDGFLSVLEILGLEIPADAVVLSACETGLGTEMGGEGLLSLATAFLSAGSPRVVASLWKVDSAATSALMKRFYELWNPESRAGVSAVSALRRAQEDLRTMKGGCWGHPYFWAGWVLWGLAD